MPRVASQPRPRQVSASTPQKQPHATALKLPLNDDRKEKAARFQSRQALHDLQLNSLKAAASPIRKSNNKSQALSDSPKTPRNFASGKENVDSNGVAVVGALAATPVKRIPLLANFEEWMKMATDNKINAANSWNFALIDYFHDMSLLKEGDSVNFQKASCTLDGCVKIYTSRVDSVATETGKLLSGLADSANKKGKREGEGEEEDEEGRGEEEDQDIDGSGKRKPKRKTQRSSEATLASSFASLQLKKMELEFSVDPLFKKASADFDEGGAKGLLLNHLTIDGKGRIVFDSSDDQHATSGELSSTNPSEAATDAPGTTEEIDVSLLSRAFFPDVEKLDNQDICPALKAFDLGDPGAAEIGFLKASADWKQERDNNTGGEPDLYSNLDQDIGFDDDGQGVLGGLAEGAALEFGAGGEAWANNITIGGNEHQDEMFQGHGNPIEGNEFGPQGIKDQELGPKLQTGKLISEHENILAFFDNTMQKNWAGPENWRIRRIKDVTKSSASGSTKRKEKEPFEIDFLAPLDSKLAEALKMPEAPTASISLPKSQWISKSKNLLPDDRHFSSRDLLGLFLKPKARLTYLKRMGKSGAQNANPQLPEGELDEAFWANKASSADHLEETEQDAGANYDANFFQDDAMPLANGVGADDDVFTDAQEVLQSDTGSLPIAAHAKDEGTAFGSQLLGPARRARPEYVQYARVAKKVDVRKLKEEMWKGIEMDKSNTDKTIEIQPPSESDPLKFTTVMNNLQQVYPVDAMNDISTSYCFICLLHLANEKGLQIENQPGFEELSIRKDQSVGNIELESH